MKFVIVLALIASIAVVNAEVELSEEQKAKAKNYLAECKESVGVSDDEIVALRSGENSNDSKCFANCFFEKAGILKDGALQEKTILEKFGPIIGEDKASELLDLCRGEVEPSKCETAYNLFSCLKKNKAILE